MRIESYREMLVWQRAMDLVVECYRLSDALPRSELFGLAAQIRRSACSVPANVAEGVGRKHLGDYLRHLSIANGSLKETETHLLVAGRVGYLAESDVQRALEQSAEVGKMLAGLIRRLQSLRPRIKVP